MSKGGGEVNVNVAAGSCYCRFFNDDLVDDFSVSDFLRKSVGTSSSCLMRQMTDFQTASEPVKIATPSLFANESGLSVVAPQPRVYALPSTLALREVKLFQENRGTFLLLSTLYRETVSIAHR